MSSTTFDAVADILQDKFNLDRAKLRPDVALSEMGLDSLALMEFVFAVEDAFGLRIPEERLDPRASGLSLDGVCQVIDALRSEASGQPVHAA
ncbi:MAG TPA: phosphopantetheine-binding protein [Variovorax sp.]